MTEGIWALLGLAIGALVGWLYAGARARRAYDAACEAHDAELEQSRAQTQTEREGRIAAETRLEETSKQLEAQRALLDEATARMSETFKAISSDALQTNSQAFITSAKQTLEPLQQTLNRYEQQVSALEKSRREDYGSLAEQVKSLMLAEQQLQRETGNLVNALRRPQVRGRWGEMTLRRVAELAGMSQHCDFEEQVSVASEGGRLRPDMIVKLPGERMIVVDAKCSLEAYLNSIEASDETTRKTCLGQHCRQLRDHMNGLAQKSYWDQFPSAPEFVVMFVPGESFLAAAMDEDPKLFDEGLQKKVLLAGPINLIALLQAAAHGWRQEQVEESALRISDLGKQLYERLRVFAGHIGAVGKRLDGATEAYNQAIGSLESRVLPMARRFQEMGSLSVTELPTLEPSDAKSRQLTAPEAGEGEA